MRRGILDALRERVLFCKHNLAADATPQPGLGAMDVILCRNVLMYFSPQGIRQALQRFSQRLGDQHVVLFDHLMTRRAGQRRFINVHMHVPPTWTLGRADDQRHQVEHALAEAVPGLHASIQMLPDGVEPITADLNEPLPEAAAAGH